MAGNTSSMKSLVAYKKIRDLILTGEKLPGTRLVISDLESELKIGKGPIREALMRLDRSGLVKNIPYKGAMVASPPSQKEIVILFKIRIELETQLAVEAINKITEDQIAELEAIYEKMVNSTDNYYALDRQFHSIIYEASKLPHLSTIVDKLVESLETFLTLYRHDPADCQKFSHEHLEILKAIKLRDHERVEETMSGNIRSGLEVVERTLFRLAKQSH